MAEPETLPPVSLIVCSRNRPRLLYETVASVLASDVLPAELIVVDQSPAPHPQLSALSNVPGTVVRYISSPTVGLSRANNLGIRLATHELLAFTHDDVRVAPDWLRQLAGALVEAGSGCVVSGQVGAGEESGDRGFVPLVRTGDLPRTYRGRVWEDILDPLNMAMYREVFERVGTFDVRLGPGTAFPGGEDNDLGYRLLEAGYCIRYVPEACVTHRAWRSEREFLPLRWSYGLAQGAFYAKHLSVRDRYIMQRYALELRHRANRFLRRREWRAAIGDVLYVLGMFTGSLHWTARYRLPARFGTTGRDRSGRR